ncbi:Plasma membrane ATPase [Pleurostoma richardsiae]|uniref:Plasma membrane ATPase n=1 Tax=Pleurostoma richardsiae TaxID=41990 RepID=A0AA38R867_9PEZI|nr:Plasma membrane ATPase [Pleurostoma richardsiae]
MSRQSEIPGYYFDPERNRYFKIERNQTAPAGASWSATAVKRRKVEDKEATKAKKQLELIKSRIQRAKLLAEPSTGGFLQRELGASVPDLTEAIWAKGLRDKGEIPFVYANGPERPKVPNIPGFYVDGSDHKTGLGAVYGTLGDRDLYSCYIPTDANDRVRFATDEAAPEQLTHTLRRELIPVPYMSSIKYHAPSNSMLLTSREPRAANGLSFFSPPLRRDEEGPVWGLGESQHYIMVSLNSLSGHDNMVVNTCEAASDASSVTCLVGANTGIIRLRTNGSVSYLTPKPDPEEVVHHNPEPKDYPTDIFSIDFQRGGHPEVFFAGGRPGRLWMCDIRTPVQEWDWMRHPSSIAHVRSVSEHRVLALGPRSAMAVYDIRAGWKESAEPCVRFPEYRNREHVYIGAAAEPEIGVVAAAHDDGKVAIYSCMMFQTMPLETHPSLWVGVGPYVKKISFGTSDDGTEDETW